ncbi:MAG: heavy metal translocating P-type ATPase metal-binding domain-containing protein [Chitinophagaceae bacterium]|nr:heavy metal translocating P-type ATPase metal-binding domain-containing protein [Chitinophagaceae bacterium]
MNTTTSQTHCYHCGEEIISSVHFDEKEFCCQGCKSVYSILRKNDLCEYYKLNNSPGASLQKEIRSDKFLFLDDEGIRQKLIQFENSNQTHITFYLPQMHCSSCLYLLENLHRINPNIISSRVNFPGKEVTIIFNHGELSLSKLAALLSSVGYEPYISLHDLQNKKPPYPKSMIYQLGVAGFCFANIMLLSFPEYLGFDGDEKALQSVFRMFNIALALPVLLYSAQPFFESAWKGLRNRFLNIDAPVALAILITFFRSLYEVYAGISAGYFDSMTGIVFFMLVGRVLQNKTYQQLSFERDYTSYFPVAVTVLKNDTEQPTALPELKVNDTLLIHHDEIIPADGILTRGKAFIDYSFVTGESVPVAKEIGEIIYAGGRQTGSNIELLTIKEVTQSYLTQLWNKDNRNNAAANQSSFVHALSRWFTWMVLALAAAGAWYWSYYDSAKAWNVITTVLIVACPCALLLSNSFTNGNILRLLGRYKFYLRNAQVIEDLAAVDHIVFDKTGTLTSTAEQDIEFEGDGLTKEQEQLISALAAQSTHPLSRALVQQPGKTKNITVSTFKETPGRGIEGVIRGNKIVLGSSPIAQQDQEDNRTKVHVVINNEYLGYFVFRNHYRHQLQPLINTLKKDFQLSVISGDSDAELPHLRKLFGTGATLLFQQQPHQKLNYIRQLQQQHNVLMIGDGLNDAGALQQSNVGIAITEDTNNFTPASDAVLDAKSLHLLPAFIQLCRANKQIIMAAFILSIVYNVAGLFFALQGILSPLVAAILMPSSSISILLVTFGCSGLMARWLLPKSKEVS